MNPNLLAVGIATGIVVHCLGPSPVASPDGSVGPDAPAHSSAKEDATNQLVELLTTAFNRKPGEFDDQYWIRNDYGRFWARLVDLLDRGADTKAAYRRGANVWGVAFVADPKCRCAVPYGWEGLVPPKCANPQYYPRCEKQDRIDREKRIEVLLARGVDPNLNLTRGSARDDPAPLCIAVNTGLTESVVRLISHKASCTKPPCSTTLLHSAARHRTSDVLCALIGCGVAVDGRDNRGATPLFEAAEWGPTRNVAALLDYGADPNAKNNDGDEAISVARRKRKSAVVRLLTRWKAPGASQATHSACGPRGE